MIKFDCYIGVIVFVVIFVVFGVIFGLVLLFVFIDEFNDISVSYGIGDVLCFIFFIVLWCVYDMLLMVVLIGCLVGFGILVSNSELIIMCVVGVFLLWIVWVVMKLMLVLMLVGILVGEYVVFWIENIVQSGCVLVQGGGDL